MRPSPVSVHTDFTAAELKAMAPGPHRHAPLGFYRNAVGYRLTVDVRARRESSCQAVAVDAQLVEVRREIEIANDLLHDPCLMHVALEHYKRHAEAAEEALQDLAHDLPVKLRDIVLQTTQMKANISLQGRLKKD